jgi:hypothetical protein
MQGNNLEEEIASNTANLTPQEDDALTPLEGKTGETIHIHYFPDAIVILREGEEVAQETNVIDTTIAGTTATEHTTVSTEQTQPPEQEAKPMLNEKKITRHALLTVSFYLFLILSGLLLQSSMSFTPPTVTITIIAKSQQLSVNGTLQLGRMINAITLSQSQTAPTTGRGHQDARAATGFITFYNGQLQSVTVPAGTMLTGDSGIEIVTDQNAYIPAERQTIPPTLGQTTISAHTVLPGIRGNIPPGDINQSCCAASVLAQNTAQFHGGQDERNFQTVTQADINGVATALQTTLIQSMQGALQAQLQPDEQLQLLPCSPTLTADHHIGEEAVQIRVTASETCMAAAYNEQRLQTQAKDILTAQAYKTLGAGYSLLGDLQVTVKQATTTTSVLRNSPTPPVTLSFSCVGTWVYALANADQEHIKSLIAGHTKQEALHMLKALPGIESASINWGSAVLPKDSAHIHFVIFAL